MTVLILPPVNQACLEGGGISRVVLKGIRAWDLQALRISKAA